MSRDTLRECEACGGRGLDCPWCNNGLQTLQQQRSWKRFRKRMRKLSGTYSVLEDLILDILDRLGRRGDTGSDVLCSEGMLIMHRWRTLDPLDERRLALFEEMKDYTKRALDHLEKHTPEHPTLDEN